MAKGRKKKSKKPKKRWRTRTWVVGYAPVPLTAAPPGSVPMLALVVEQPEGTIVASELIDAAAGGGGPGALVHLVAHAMEEPVIGPPRSPDRFLVAREAELAALEDAFGLPASLGSTAVLERIAKQFAAYEEELLEHGEPVDRSYFDDGATPEQVGALFDAAARLYRLAPWNHLTVDMPVRLHAPHVGLDDAVAAVLGADGVSFAVVLFETVDIYEVFMAETSQNRPPTVPLEALNWDPASELPKTMRKEAMRHAWPVADRDAYPWVLVRGVDGALPTRPKAVRRCTVAALALVELCRAFENAPGEVVGDLTFDAFGGPVAVAEMTPVLSVADVEHDMLRAISVFAQEEHDDLFDDAFGCFDVLEDAVHIGMRRLIYDLHTGDGKTVADEFVARHGVPDSLTGALLTAQDAAGVGLWEVQSVTPGEVVLWEPLSERRRVLRHMEAAGEFPVGASFLARVIDWEGEALLSGVHPQPLAPDHAEAVVAKMRKRLRRKSAVPVARLYEAKHVDALVRAFVEAKSAQGAEAPPRLWDAPSDAEARSPGVAAIQQFKAQHYGEWPDIPVPALGDRTPREAARTEHGRAVLVELIDSMEEGELQLPVEQRYDFGVLRRELGLD